MQADFHPARRAWLAVIALTHLAVLMAWRPVLRLAAEPSIRSEGELVFLTPVPAKRPHPAEPRQRPAPVAPARPVPPPPVAAARPDAPPAASAAATQNITLPAPPAGEPADPFAKPLASLPTLLEKSRTLAASADRQLRKESLNKFAVIVQEQSPLAKQLARAYTGEVVLEQVSTMADGRTMKRYRVGSVEFCEYVNLVGAAGQDPFRDGNKYQVKSCP